MLQRGSLIIYRDRLQIHTLIPAQASRDNIYSYVWQVDNDEEFEDEHTSHIATKIARLYLNWIADHHMQGIRIS